MEYIVLGLFCISLLLCISLNISIIYALLAGLILFMFYGRHKGFSWKSLISMAINGIKTVSNILITFILIGVMTALWRASGTIPFIVSKASTLIRPSVFLLMTFLLNSALSVLTGTSLGTSATMGVICASIGSAIIACNQTLTILLCNQLCSGLYKEKDKLAVDLEDTAVVIAPLIPWSIAGAVPLATVGAPSTAIFASFYLLLLPIYRLRSARYEKS